MESGSAANSLRSILGCIPIATIGMGHDLENSNERFPKVDGVLRQFSAAGTDESCQFEKPLRIIILRAWGRILVSGQFDRK
jgi:hypothetical protein